MDLYLLQEKVALNKAVAEESLGASAVLEKAGWVWPSPGVGTHQLTVMRDQSLGNLWAQTGHERENTTGLSLMQNKYNNLNMSHFQYF